MDASETDDESLVGDTCHIVAESPSGPRGDSPLTRKQRDQYDNLILLCKVHHKLVDDQRNTYTVERLREMKVVHEKWVRESLQPTSPICNVPHPRNPNFTGRESLLADLRTALTADRSAALTQTQAISGLGGVGKTQLATEYAYRHAAEYDVVWWVRAEEPVTLAADYATLARPLNLPQKDDPDQRLVVQAVRRWFAQHDGWLLILDNAPGPAEVRGYLPQATAGHVLVTSRNPNWRGQASPLTVQVLERPESVAFLLKRTGRTDEADDDELAQELGDLPLALEQAGAYIEASGRSFSGYLDLFRQRQREMLNLGTLSTDYPHTVATTWDLSFQAVREAAPAGADLLNLCAFLAPDDIPQDLLSEGAQHLPTALAQAIADPLALDEAVAALRRYSLLEVAGDALSVHRLVQAVARDQLTDDAHRTWTEAAVRIVDDAFPSDVIDDLQAWPLCARLLPHALVAAGQAETLAVAPEATGRLLNQAGLYLRGRAEFAEAKAALERALAIDEAAFGPDHPNNVARDVNNLGLVLQDLGDLDGARAAFERALAIDEVVFGPDHPNVARNVNNLGSVLKDLGDLDGARACYEQALAILEKQLGPEHPQVATGVNNLGLVLQDLGDLDGAQAHFQRALAIWEKQLGPDHPKVAIGVNNLGLVLQNLGDLDGAQAHFQRALAIDEAAFGPDHPKVATDVKNLGGVLKDLGDLDEARAHFQRALAIDEVVFGPDHPNVARNVNNLGLVLQDLGDLDGARTHFQRALAIDEAAFVPDHPAVARDINNLGGVLRALGDLDGARAHYQRALAIAQAAFGSNHPNVAIAVGNLGKVLRDLGDLAGARAHFERALAIFQATRPSGHPHIEIARGDLESVEGGD
jgi:tetratricopeptide (TPR) repeat protein